ncbi:MAG: D-cysteine desulfhydrase family protein [Armatimonadota bacterium]
MMLNDVPRLKLGHLPTPLDEAPRLAKALGLRRLLVKRDDQTGLGLGGNKVRKLEFLMADAVRKNADVVLTIGGPQSNHARLTAAAARRLGMDSVLVLAGPRFKNFDGNLLLDIIFDAEIRYLPDAGVAPMEKAMDETALELEQTGRRPYVIPMGGSSPLGVLGYANAVKELAGQLGDEKEPQIIAAVGSGGTLAGLTLGAKMFLPGARIIGISVARPIEPFEVVVSRVAAGGAELIGEDTAFDSAKIEISCDYVGDSYGVPSEAGVEAILLAARTEALVLDPVYTGKAMSGLIGMAQKGTIDRDRTTVFIHTGGSPALFANERYFHEMAKYTEVK